MSDGPDLAERAARFSDDLLNAVRQGSDLTAMTTDIDTLGARATDVVTRAAASAVGRADGGTRAQTLAITDALATLQELARTLTPNRDLSEPATADRYFDGYRRQQGTLAAVLDALRLGRELLDRDDTRLAEVDTAVRAAASALTRYAALAAGIDEGLAAATLSGAAEQTRQDLLFAVRQRRQDLLTEIAVAEQLIVSLAISRRNAVALAAAVRRAVDCTVTALAVAVVAAEAVTSRRLVFDQISAARDVTAATLRSTAATGTSLEPADGASASRASLVAAFADLDDALTMLDHTVATTHPSSPTSGDAL